MAEKTSEDLDIYLSEEEVEEGRVSLRLPSVAVGKRGRGRKGVATGEGRTVVGR